MKPFDSSGAFHPLVEAGGLRRAAVRSAAVTVLAQVVAFAVQLTAMVVLARLLVPSDFGVVTMVTTFSVLLVSCGQIGFPDAVLQSDEMNHLLASNLFWINVGLGLVLTLVFAATGSLLARFYGDPRVAHVAIGVSLTIFITSTSVLHLALLRRAMRFSAVSGNDIVARAVSVVVSVLLAWAGWGYWALVAGVIAQPLSTSVGAWVLCRWMPGLPRRADGTGAMVRFARNLFARWSVGYFTQNTDNLLVGWRFGSGPLGFYKKAYDLSVLPFNLLTVYPVAVSTLSRLTRDPIQYRRYFLRGLSILALLGMGLGASLTLVGKDLVRLMLGSRWEMTGQIFTLFGPGIGAMLIYSTHGMIHLSLGTTGRYFRWGLIEVSVTCLMFFLGLRWGPSGIALAWTASYWLLALPSFWYAGKPIQLDVGSIVAAVWKYTLASFAAGVACFEIVRQLPSLAGMAGAAGAVARIIAYSLLFTALYIGTVIVLHGGCEPLYQLLRLVKDMAPWGKVSRVSPVEALPSAGDAGLVLAPTGSREAT